MACSLTPKYMFLPTGFFSLWIVDLSKFVLHDDERSAEPPRKNGLFGDIKFIILWFDSLKASLYSSLILNLVSSKSITKAFLSSKLTIACKLLFSSFILVYSSCQSKYFLDTLLFT